MFFSLKKKKKKKKKQQQKNMRDHETTLSYNIRHFLSLKALKLVFLVIWRTAILDNGVSHDHVSLHMSLVTRKSVFGVFDQVRLKPTCAATEASWRLEISDKETTDIILSRQRTSKVRGCADWCWSDCADAQADLRLCCSHMAKTGFLMTWLNYYYGKWLHTASRS